jgi:phosphomevalonate kinase
VLLGVDDVASECDLDAVTDWDWILTNNGQFEDENLQDLEQWIHSNL